ncbi:MAG: aminoacyl-tRNA hydrolase [Desulfobulbaceae bacterium]|uniref:Peptidyl-tRNA hydrolase n=1 Tax=Candidatus Desulfobia pelagia TaxID=2841692 RepID=A0A8J6TFM5_9BACT|nr:aminoacyl-tRNA hydrolase [Candidatus Desulfobia pelagia]
MFLIAGLGNPGSEYENTRHNVGFLFLDHLAELLKVSFTQSKWQALDARTTLSGEQVLLLKPQTYMNKSGFSVSGAASYYKVSSDNIIVVHDDIDLPFGKLKITVNRGPGGHNGIKSIISHLGSQDFIRIRVGIGRPETPIPVDRYVLSKLSTDEIDQLQGKYKLIDDSLNHILTKGVVLAMNRLHSVNP